VRISALSHLPSIWILTHDSIGVGEDGPTHQPVEHFASLRAIPGLVTIRPCDGNETVHAWRVALKRQNAPTALILTRQNLPTLDRSRFSDAALVEKGAYVLADLGDHHPDIILMASGSEVSLIVEAAEKLVAESVAVRLVSFPSWELFKQQPQEYQLAVLPSSIRARLAVEAGISMGWERFVGTEGAIIGIDHFGASAPATTLFKEFGFTVDHVVNNARKLVNK
jgi:transketolase